VTFSFVRGPIACHAEQSAAQDQSVNDVRPEPPGRSGRLRSDVRRFVERHARLRHFNRRDGCMYVCMCVCATERLALRRDTGLAPARRFHAAQVDPAGACKAVPVLTSDRRLRDLLSTGEYI